MLHGAIFDMDGVLVDNMKVHLKAFMELARRYGVTSDISRVLGMGGMGNAEIFAEIFPPDLVERVGVGTLGSEKEAIYREMYAPTLAPAKGLIRFFDDLKAHGVKIAVGTSACRENMDFVFDGLDIRRYFDAVVNADMVSHTKPHPEIYLRALDELDIPAGECLVFEDAVAGVMAAHAAGIKVVALPTSTDRATLLREPGVVLVIDDFTETGFDELATLVC